LKNEFPSDKEFEVHFNLLYSVYSIPNIILPFFGGNLADIFGQAECLVAFCCFTLLGQLIFAAGLYIKSWTLMFIGRGIYGCGGETLTVATSAILSTWFANGKEISMAFGINLAVSRLGSVLNNILSPTIADASSPFLALLGGSFMNFCSFTAALVIFYTDRISRRKLDQQNQIRGLLTVSFLEDHEAEQEEQSVRCSDNNHIVCVSYTTPENDRGKRFSILFWLLSFSCVVVYGCIIPFNDIASGILLERNYFKWPGVSCTLLHPNQCSFGTLSPNGSNPSISQIDGSPCPGKGYAPVLPSSLNITYTKDSWDHKFYSFPTLSSSDVHCEDPFWAEACTKNYCDSQKYATEMAGRVMSIPYFLSAILSPFLGYIIDKIGRRAVIVSVAPLILVAVHGALALGNGSPILPLVFQGVSYSLYAAVIWPSIPLVVGPTVTGSAYGTITSLQNLGLATFPFILGEIYNTFGAYIPFTEIFFVLLAAFGTVIGLALNLYDKKTGGTLNSVCARASSMS
jgi:MFS family permease